MEGENGATPPTIVLPTPPPGGIANAQTVPPAATNVQTVSSGATIMATLMPVLIGIQASIATMTAMQNHGSPASFPPASGPVPDDNTTPARRTAGETNRTPSMSERQRAEQIVGKTKLPDTVENLITRNKVPPIKDKSEYTSWKRHLLCLTSIVFMPTYQILIGTPAQAIADYATANAALYSILVIALNTAPFAASYFFNVLHGDGASVWRNMTTDCDRHTDAIRSTTARDLMGIRQRDNETMKDYGARAESLHDKLGGMGTPLSDPIVTGAWLQGMHVRFRNIQHSMAMHRAKMTLQELVLATLDVMIATGTLDTAPPDDHSFLSATMKKTWECWNCGKTGSHYQSDCNGPCKGCGKTTSECKLKWKECAASISIADSARIAYDYELCTRGI